MDAYSIHYTLSFREPQAHYMEVQMIIKNLNSESKSINVKMPVWTPGSYLVREYSRHIESFQVQHVNEKKKTSFQKRCILDYYRYFWSWYERRTNTGDFETFGR